MSKQTPGPWKWQQCGDWCLMGDHGMRPIVLNVGQTRESKRPVLRVRDSERDVMVGFDPAHSDARLIAAAPDLLEALEAILPFAVSDEKPYEDRSIPEARMSPELLVAYKLARIALSKAKGQP